MIRRSLSLLGLLPLLGCAPKPGEEFRGQWVALTNGAAFQPCGSSERWWATFDSTFETTMTVETTMVFIAQDSGGQTPALPQAPPLPPPTFTILRGDTSKVGSYGPGGAYRRQVIVHDMGGGAADAHEGAV